MKKTKSIKVFETDYRPLRKLSKEKHTPAVYLLSKAIQQYLRKRKAVQTER